VQLNPVASTVLVIFYLVTSVALVAILGFFVYALAKLNAKLESLESRIDPLLVKTEEILTLTNDKIVTFGERTEGILTHGEAVAEEVHDKVERTATTVQRTINAPIIGLNSVAAGLVRGLYTFSHLQKRQKDKIEEPLSSEPMVITSSPIQSHSLEVSTPPAVDSTANSNGIPVAIRAGKGN
jgi:uncharacterized protein YoxC